MTQSKVAESAAAQHKGAQIQSKESFLYGRFETMLCPAYGSGIVSSFFTFNDAPGFQKAWNEIDFEFLGRNTNSIDTNVIRTVNGKTSNSENVQAHPLSKRSTDVYWKLGIDWNPERVVWYINDVTVRTWVGKLDKPQKLMANIWVGSPGWAGPFNGGLLPQSAYYRYVRYTSLDGKSWQDDFLTLDLNRWQVATWPLESTVWVKENVSVVGGELILKLTQ